MEKTKRKKILIFLAVFVFIGFGFCGTRKASADFCQCMTRNGLSDYNPIGEKKEFDSVDACEKYCTSSFSTNYYKFGSGFTVNYLPFIRSASVPDAALDAVAGPAKTATDWILLKTLTVLGWLLSLSATLFAWIIDPENMKAVINNPVIYQTWALVRDMLNIAFILVLLFSAFATVFQVSNYNYKKILLNLVIMALLVNFSYPIARFLVDVGNVTMYSTVNSLGILNSGSPFARIAENSSMGIILNPPSGADTSFLILSVVFTFILAVTFLIIAGLFVVRTVALAILIIFSPLAFTGAIISLLAPFSKKWWTSIWNYSIFGTTMVFMIYIAAEMTRYISVEKMGSMQDIANNQSSIDPNFFASISFFAIPIVLLWMGIGTAKTAGIEGAGLIVGQGEKFMKWAGRTLTGYRAAKFGVKRAGHMIDRDVLTRIGLSPKTIKEAWNARQTEIDKRKYGRATGAWRDRLNYIISGGKHKTTFEEAAVQNYIAEKEKEYEAKGMDYSGLYTQYKAAKKANKTEDMAAILRLITKTNEGNSFMIDEAMAEGKSGKDVAFSPFDTTDRYIDQLMAAGMSEHMAVKQVTEMGATSVGKGMTQLHGAGIMTADGKYKRRDTKSKTERQKRVEAVQGKINETKAQTWADTFHWTSMFNQNVDGSVGDLHEMGISQLENLTGAQIQSMGRIRGDASQRTFQGIEKIKKLHKDIEAKATRFMAAANSPATKRLPKDKQDELIDKANKIAMQKERIGLFIDNIDKLAHGNKV